MLFRSKRTPAYARDKVISLGDISIYTVDEDVPLANVLQSIKDKNEGKKVDMDSIGDIREYFATVLPEFDDERVHTSDIKKVFAWYNQLVDAGEDSFIDEEEESEENKNEA